MPNLGSPGEVTATGDRLPPLLRGFFEQRMNHDLGHVRIHTGPDAAASAQALQAKAFALGPNIAFGRGQYAPDDPAGRRLLAHELAHIVRGDSDGVLRREPDPNAPTATPAPTTAPTPDSPAAPPTPNAPTATPNAPPTLAAPAARPTLDSLIRTNPPGFTDPALDRAYQDYRAGKTAPSDPRLWALRVTSGAPRERLEQLLGADYARGQRTGEERPPVDVGQAVAPVGYGTEQASRDLAALNQDPSALTDRLQNMINTPIDNSQVSAGHFNILQGNVAELLARPMLQSRLEDIRRENPDAQLFFGLQARVMRKDGTPSDPVLFSDGVIAAVRPGGLQIFRVAEVKSGAEGGVQGQEQIHRWIEGHSTQTIELIIPGLARTFRLSETVREVVGLARAPRTIIAPRGARFPTEASGHGTAAPTERAELAQSAEEINYLTRLVAQQIIQLQQARRLLDQARSRQLAAGPIESLDELQSPTVVQRLLNDNNGTALVRGQLYRVGFEGESIRVRILAAAPIAVPRAGPAAAGAPPSAVAGALPAPPTGVPPAETAAPGGTAPGPGGGPPALPAPPAAGAGPGGGGPLVIPGQPPSSGIVPPNVINFTGNDIVVGGRTITPTPSGDNLREGELVVIGSQSYWVVSDIRTRQPIAGVFEGGEWYRVVAGGRVLPIDADGRLRTEVEPIPFEHLPAVAQTGPPRPPGEGPAGGGPGAGAKVVAGGLGIIMVVNELLGPLGQALQAQRRNIALGRAEIDFWLRFGANPKFGVWSQNDRHALPKDAEPETAVFGSPSFPYVADIDVAAFSATLQAGISNYRDFLLFLDLARTLDTIQEIPAMPSFPTADERRTPRRYLAVMNKYAGPARLVYDVTDTINAVRDRTLAALDDQTRAHVRDLPQAEQGNIFRLRNGSETQAYRSARGGQPILSGKQLFGDDPWVRPLGGRSSGGFWAWFRYGSGARVLVEPANADAQQAMVTAVYNVKQSIEDTLEEVKAGGRPIIQRQPPEGRLESFVAGPDQDGARFGETRYYRNPENPENQTAAIGELHQFWVDPSDLAPVAEQDVETYANRSPKR
jgi:hypothetical protein